MAIVTVSGRFLGLTKSMRLNQEKQQQYETFKIILVQRNEQTGGMFYETILQVNASPDQVRNLEDILIPGEDINLNVQLGNFKGNTYYNLQ